MVCDGTKSTLDKQRARGNQEQKAVGRCPPYDDNCGKFSQYPFRHVPNSLDWKRRRGKVGLSTGSKLGYPAVCSIIQLGDG